MSSAAAVILAPEARDFYVRSIALLNQAGVPFLVGGAYAFARYTGIHRHTKDFDLFIRQSDFDRAAKAFNGAGYESELTFPHWLGKAWQGEDFVDLIYGSGNGVARVDDLWFEHAVSDKVFGVDVKLIPAEEMIWSKGLIMERERFDGADVAHLIKNVGKKLDWRRLLDRFDKYWHVLYAHLVLFRFIYPSARSNVPSWVMLELTKRIEDEMRGPDANESICNGTILSRQQYLHDIQNGGFKDARLEPMGNMSEKDIKLWTAGIATDGAK